MTIKTPRSPTSPTTPTSAHPLDGGFIVRPPRLHVSTAFPLNAVLNPRSPVCLTTMPNIHSLSTPSTPSAGFRAHRSHRHTSSDVVFPSPIEVVLSQPLSSLPTPPSAHSRLFADALLSGPVACAIDGRQSRMATRNPTIVPRSPASLFSPMSLMTPHTPLYRGPHSPILEQVVNLPPRFDPRGEAVASRPSDTDCMTTFSTASTAVPSPSSSCSASMTQPRPAQACTNSDMLGSKGERSPNCKPRFMRQNRLAPPKYDLKIRPSGPSTLNAPPSLAQRSPRALNEYQNAVGHLSTPLVPLVSVTTGLPHPEFPRSLLQYHLLTHEQLDSLARWYHQVEPAREESWMYPAWIPPFTGAMINTTQITGTYNELEYRPSSGFEQVSLTVKRRRWGRFIGLRGCESPVDGSCEETGEGLVERMEREWRTAMRRAQEDEMMREKGWRGRW